MNCHLFTTNKLWTSVCLIGSAMSKIGHHGGIATAIVIGFQQKASLSSSSIQFAAFPLLGRFKELPKTLYRIQSGEIVKLRDYETQMKLERSSYDIKIKDDGFVHPKPGDKFEGPNGCSLRPNGPVMQEIIRNFKGKNIVVFTIPKGTKVPKDLVLLHEHSDHYSLQCDVAMTLPELNEKLTEFFRYHAKKGTKQEWVKDHPFEDWGRE